MNYHSRASKRNLKGSHHYHCCHYHHQLGRRRTWLSPEGQGYMPCPRRALAIKEQKRTGAMSPTGGFLHRHSHIHIHCRCQVHGQAKDWTSWNWRRKDLGRRDLRVLKDKSRHIKKFEFIWAKINWNPAASHLAQIGRSSEELYKMKIFIGRRGQ